jgi:CRP-like cAMP-binding protein
LKSNREITPPSNSNHIRDTTMRQHQHDTVGNRFLAALPSDLVPRLAFRLEPVLFRHGDVITHPGDPADYVYFLDRGLFSLVKVMNDGRAVEVGFVGTEGMLGVSALLGLEHWAFEAIVQLDGSGHRLKTTTLRVEMERSHAFKELVLRYVYYAESQISQAAACNRLHNLMQRCCRWLLTACGNARASSFAITHEFLALMVGVNRPSLSLIVSALQRAAIITYKRSTITVLDRNALEQRSCECYETLRQEMERVYRP